MKKSETYGQGIKRECVAEITNDTSNKLFHFTTLLYLLSVLRRCFVVIAT